MLLSAVSFGNLASSKVTILVRLVSQAGTGFSFNHKRSRLREKLTLLHYDPIVMFLAIYYYNKKGILVLDLKNRTLKFQ
ncbi:Mrpl33 [Phodopus roborovskii]|uniref:Large ribosomal subunit protein bL33m n=1 Tax=Phodopus roborovskii TaxID=109678 RepID=A0AAU9Z512_PHORO|nr:Mrpl33 [Phodopus roborovskii]